MRGGNISFLDDKLTKYLGDKSAKAFKTNFGYTTVKELLNHFPRRYVQRGELTALDELPLDEDVTVVATVVSVNTRRMRARRGIITEVLLHGEDQTGLLSLTFFNQYGLENRLPVGALGMFSGKVSQYQGKLTLSHPDFQLIDEDEDVEKLSTQPMPLYPAKAKLSSWIIQRSINVLLDTMPAHLADPLDQKFKFQHKLLSLHDAYIAVHRGETLKQCLAGQHRFRFEEAFLTQLALVKRKADNAHHRATSYKPYAGGLKTDFDENLPFKLTEEQLKVSEEIDHDLAQEVPMNRLLQGDVGSGKTIVALRAMLSVIEAGGQAVLLAPTEVLASQHFQSVYSLLGELNFKGVSLALLTGSMSAKEKKNVLLNVASGQTNLLVATHAVLSEQVMFADLGLVVIDEQHRFGVDQRDVLRQKGHGKYPHVLVMTATPIPRSVAMTMFGDLEISTLKGLPAGRAPIATHVVNLTQKPHWATRIIERMQEDLNQGHQVYVVCSRIGDEETSSDRYSVLDFTEVLSQNLPHASVAMLHSRLDTDIKDRTMAQFVAGKVDVLVSTTIIEVGVDVANATMMVIMDADSFGVSQLHQLRGRIGRGRLPGLCLLVTRVEPGHESLERLKAVESTTDGFKLSLLDLELRREGDVLSAQQSGGAKTLKLLKVTQHTKLLEEAREAAQELIDEDPTLEHHRALTVALAEFLDSDTEEYLEKS
ncbi:MAG: ATP-dependent DNA helicase RecG [Micrococcaceae bacterium]